MRKAPFAPSSVRSFVLSFRFIGPKIQLRDTGSEEEGKGGRGLQQSGEERSLRSLERGKESLLMRAKTAVCSALLCCLLRFLHLCTLHFSRLFSVLTGLCCILFSGQLFFVCCCSKQALVFPSHFIAPR